MTLPRTRTIRCWLLQLPKPHSLRITSGDDVHALEIGTKKWTAVATSVEALDPDKVEALDSDGKLLRAIKAEQLDESTTVDEDTTSPTAVAKSDARQLEREMAMLVKFGELLADAYKHSTSVAFGKMVELFDATSRRGESLEKSLASTEKLLRRAYEEGASGGGDKEPSLLESMLTAFANGQAQHALEGTVATATKKPTNGKAQI
jgi:hypothetical protein